MFVWWNWAGIARCWGMGVFLCGFWVRGLYEIIEHPQG
ncbi:MAG: hypothetical protein KatS3mg017_0164 [Fimbriimonadales bacterium]|nr:MAG: hypothetical protein KatS3mg017_0164 [Fimbriimonadales bacterium]GIV08915.1 MAG: hypothetical protein KatS3mg019_1006 [Fimbriimonadales bacterium]